MSTNKNSINKQIKNLENMLILANVFKNAERIEYYKSCLNFLRQNNFGDN